MIREIDYFVDEICERISIVFAWKWPLCGGWENQSQISLSQELRLSFNYCFNSVLWSRERAPINRQIGFLKSCSTHLTLALKLRRTPHSPLILSLSHLDCLSAGSILNRTWSCCWARSMRLPYAHHNRHGKERQRTTKDSNLHRWRLRSVSSGSRTSVYAGEESVSKLWSLSDHRCM